MRLLTKLGQVLLVSCSPPDGPHETFYENGQLETKGNYKNGKEEGLWEIFFYDGRLRSKNCYKNDEEVDMSFCEDQKRGKKRISNENKTHDQIPNNRHQISNSRVVYNRYSVGASLTP